MRKMLAIAVVLIGASSVSGQANNAPLNKQAPAVKRQPTVIEPPAPDKQTSCDKDVPKSGSNSPTGEMGDGLICAIFL
jgi:hypothetical protein